MFRALWWKEWRQLRLLRWSGAGIGLALPPFLLVTAEAGERGWTIFGGIASYKAATVVQEALPLVLSLAVWPLLALMTAAQAFVADRAGGTEAFLLQRPVRRSRIWQARAVAAMATTLFIIATQVVIWWLLVRLVGNPAGFDEGATLALLLIQGGIGAAVALLAGAAAAAFVRSPMQAVLLGLVLVAAPVAIGSLLGWWYGEYRLGFVPLGYGIPLFLLAGYLVSSFRMECRGEPAGRGRLRRGLVVLAAALVAMPVFLAATAPVVMRWDAKLGLGNTSLYPSPSGRGAVVLNNWRRAGWLIDTVSGERVRFFPPPVSGIAWNDAGDRLAVIHSAGGLGRRLPDPLIEVLDASGSTIGRPIECDSCPGWWDNDVLWAGAKIVTKAFVEGGTGVLIVDPATGERRAVPLPPGPSTRWGLTKTRDGEGVFVIRLVKSAVASTEEAAGKSAVLYRVDVETASLDEEFTVRGVDSLYHARQGLSPSGKSWLRLPSEQTDRVEILDLETGETVPLASRRATWLAGDRLAWVEAEEDGAESKLMIGRPGEARVVRSFHTVGTWLRASPAGDKLLVAIRMREDPSRIVHRVYDLHADRWLKLGQPPQADPTPWYQSIQWAGPGTLAFVGQGFLALQDLGRPETLEYVIGRPGS